MCCEVGWSSSWRCSSSVRAKSRYPNFSGVSKPWLPGSRNGPIGKMKYERRLSEIWKRCSQYSIDSATDCWVWPGRPIMKNTSIRWQRSVCAASNGTSGHPTVLAPCTRSLPTSDHHCFNCRQVQPARPVPKVPAPSPPGRRRSPIPMKERPRDTIDAYRSPESGMAEILSYRYWSPSTPSRRSR